MGYSKSQAPLLESAKDTAPEFSMEKIIYTLKFIYTVKTLSQTLVIFFHEPDRWQMKQDHFTEDSKHRQMKLPASTCLKVGIKCKLFGALQTYLCYLYFVWVFLPFSSFCPCATLLCIVHSGPSNMTTFGSWTALGRLERHSLPLVSSAWVCP